MANRRLSKGEKSAANVKFVERYLRDLNCPRSLTCWLLYKFGEHDQLAELDCSPYDYNDYRSFEEAFRATKFLSKASFLKTSHDKTEVALSTFFAAEEACRITNERIDTLIKKSDPVCANLLAKMSRKISAILGDFDPDEFFSYSGWGPGVSQKVKRDTSKPNKFHREDEITRAAYDLVDASARLAYPLWYSSFERRIVPARNHVITVPKNAKTDRTIAIEPGLNLYYQKGCGSMIRQRLRRFGVNLNDSGKNQAFARIGSRDNTIVTVDYSAASDTISLRLIREVLPRDWLCVLESLRCTGGVLRDGRVINYEKFSSMGNGFTFELESLIFFTLALIVSEETGADKGKVTVFGDDVTLDPVAYELYCSYSELLGFTVNKRKSYCSSNFRESCGAYYWAGACVKPFFFKKEFYDEATLYDTANSVRLRHITADSACSDGRFRRSWRFLVHIVSGLTGGRVCKVPLHFSGGLVCNFDEVCPPRARHFIEGFWCTHLHAKPASYVADHGGLLLSKLTEIGGTDSATGNEIALARHTKMTRCKSLVQLWPDVGPWV